MKRVGNCSARWPRTMVTLPVLERLAQRVEARSAGTPRARRGRGRPGGRASPRRGAAASRRRPAPTARSCGAARGMAGPRSASRSWSPATLWIRVTSIASAPGERRAGSRAGAGRASSCRCRAAPRAAGCGRRRRRSGGPAAGWRGRGRRPDRALGPAGARPASAGRTAAAAAARPRDRRRGAQIPDGDDLEALDQRRLAPALRGGRSAACSPPAARPRRRPALRASRAARRPARARRTRRSRRGPTVGPGRWPPGRPAPARRRSRARPCAGRPGPGWR